MRQFTDHDRRRRLARRHGLAPPHRHPDVVASAQAMTALHATEAATVHLALWARVADLTVGDVERALHDDRSLVKQVAMRRTLWAFPRDLLPAVWGSASARVAAQQHRQLVKNVADAGLAADPEAWVADTSAAVLDLLSDGSPRTTQQVREAVPALDGRIVVGTPGKKWGGPVPVGPRVLTTLGAQGSVVRGRNDGHWRLSRPTWLRTSDWLDDPPAPLSAEQGYAELVRRWLWTFGPGTETDLVWWLGATKSAVRRALTDVGADEVSLDDGGSGWVLAGDHEPEPEVAPWGALLPTLDPTTMGWKQRDFYLEPAHTAHLFDTNGNAGNTAWWDGRIVGAWRQDDAGVVEVLLREDVGSEAASVLDVEGARLTRWLDGVRITNVYASPQMKGAVLP